MKGPELGPKSGHPNNWDSETNFTLILRRTCQVGAVKGSELDPKTSYPNNWDSETNFTFLLQILASYCIFVLLLFFHYFYFFYFISIFYFSSFCVIFTLFVKLHCLTGFPYSLFSLHLYSNSTLLKVLYFLFLIFRSHRFYHMIVAPLLL